MFVSLPISLLIKHCYVTEALVTYLLLGLLNGGAAVSLCESELWVEVLQHILYMCLCLEAGLCSARGVTISRGDLCVPTIWVKCGEVISHSLLPHCPRVHMSTEAPSLTVPSHTRLAAFWYAYSHKRENCIMIQAGPLKLKCKGTKALNKWGKFLQLLVLQISHSMAFGMALTNITPAC